MPGTRLLRRYLSRAPRTGLEAWFYHWLRAQNQGWRKDCSPRNCYFEFGVASGRSMEKFARAAVRCARDGHIDLHDVQVVGFDSFQGLPEKSSAADEHVAWSKSAFAHPKETALRKVEEAGFPLEHIVLIEGFLESTLNRMTFDRISHLRPSIINIDLDYYSATRQALEFISPLLVSGAVFYFDDLWSFHGHPEMGQMKAIREFNGRFGYLTPCTLRDFRGKGYIFSALEWEHR